MDLALGHLRLLHSGLATACAALAACASAPSPAVPPGPPSAAEAQPAPAAGPSAAGGSAPLRAAAAPGPVAPPGAATAPPPLPGMDAAAVRRAWGEPASIRRIPSLSVPGLVYERWTWSGGREVVLVDGKALDVLEPQRSR